MFTHSTAEGYQPTPRLDVRSQPFQPQTTASFDQKRVPLHSTNIAAGTPSSSTIRTSSRSSTPVSGFDTSTPSSHRILCTEHTQYAVTHFCNIPSCLKGLCKRCIKEHNEFHRKRGEFPETETLEDMNIHCQSILRAQMSQLSTLSNTINHQLSVDSTRDRIAQLSKQLTDHENHCKELVATYFERLRTELSGSLKNSETPKQHIAGCLSELTTTQNRLVALINDLQTNAFTLATMQYVLNNDFTAHLDTIHAAVEQQFQVLKANQVTIIVDKTLIERKIFDLCKDICRFSEAPAVQQTSKEDKFKPHLEDDYQTGQSSNINNSKKKQVINLTANRTPFPASTQPHDFDLSANTPVSRKMKMKIFETKPNALSIPRPLTPTRPYNVQGQNQHLYTPSSSSSLAEMPHLISSLRDTSAPKVTNSMFNDKPVIHQQYQSKSPLRTSPYDATKIQQNYTDSLPQKHEVIYLSDKRINNGSTEVPSNISDSSQVQMINNQPSYISAQTKQLPQQQKQQQQQAYAPLSSQLVDRSNGGNKGGQQTTSPQGSAYQSNIGNQSAIDDPKGKKNPSQAFSQTESKIVVSPPQPLSSRIANEQQEYDQQQRSNEHQNYNYFQISQENLFSDSSNLKYLHFFQPKSDILHIVCTEDLKMAASGVSPDLNGYLRFYVIHIKGEDQLPISIPRFHKSICTAEGQIFLIGGISASSLHSKVVFEYNFSKNQLIKKAEMRLPRSGFGCAYSKASNAVFVIGGATNDDGVTSRCEVYDVSRNTWTEIRPAIKKSFNPAVCSFSVSGEEYLVKIGGKSDDFVMNNFIERYSISSDVWEEIVLRNVQIDFMSSACCIQINEHAIYVFGGVALNNRKSQGSFILFPSKDSKQWRYGCEGEKLLPIAEGFSNQQVIVHEGNLYIAQNISEKNQPEIIFLDRKRILSFNGNSWMALNAIELINKDS